MERGTSHGSGLTRVPLSAGETTGAAAAAPPAVPVRLLSAAVAKEENTTAAAAVAAANRCRSPRAGMGALEAPDWTFWERRILCGTFFTCRTRGNAFR